MGEDALDLAAQAVNVPLLPGTSAHVIGPLLERAIAFFHLLELLEGAHEQRLDAVLGGVDRFGDLADEIKRRLPLALQHEDGYWKGELETNVTIESEDLFLRHCWPGQQGENPRV